MQIREPVVAGQFYPEERETCLGEIRACLPAQVPQEGVPESLLGGLVPHAGWTFSGTLAALVLATVKHRRPKVDTFVIFGAAHGYFGAQPVMDGTDAWDTPLGRTYLDESWREALRASGTAGIDSSAHRREHSIEVQVPFIQFLFPDARLLPIIVPANDSALRLGAAVADVCLAHGDLKDGNAANPQSTIMSPLAPTGGRNHVTPGLQRGPQSVVLLGSTDLTHYGPRYGFTPMGVGSEALHWASEVNDRQFIDLAMSLEPQRLLANALENGNACGPGAAAAALTAAQRLGAEKGVLLAHTNSNEVMLREMGTTSRDSVGYAAIVF